MQQNLSKRKPCKFKTTIDMWLYGHNQMIMNYCIEVTKHIMDRVKRIWYLSPMRAAKVQASLHIRAVSPEPPLLAHTSSESRGTFRQKARSLAPLNGWACAVKICHDGMLEDTHSLDGTLIISTLIININTVTANPEPKYRRVTVCCLHAYKINDFEIF